MRRTTMTTPPTESEVRALRDRVYAHPISDHEWSRCRDHWMSRSGVSWLQAHDFPISESLKRAEALKAQVLRKVC